MRPRTPWRWPGGPVTALLLLAPFFGEGLSGATPPLEFVLPWRLAFLVALYGAGALLCREVVQRLGLGLHGLVLLGAAFGVYEEGVVDRFWFYRGFWDDAGVGDYSEVWHTNVLLATHLTVFHAAVSITASVLVVERIHPGRRAEPWVGRRGLVVAGLALAVVLPLDGEFDRGDPLPQTLLAAVLAALLVVAAVRSPRTTASAPIGTGAGRRWLGLTVGLAAAAHFVLVYSVPSTGLPWPLGVLLALAPVALGAVVVRRRASGGLYGADARRVLSGLIGFFVALDLLVALTGRVDMVLTALVAVVGLAALRRREVGRRSIAGR